MQYAGMVLFLLTLGRGLSIMPLQKGEQCPWRTSRTIKDTRNIDIDQVGVKGIRYPITVLDKDMGEQQTVAEINMYVNLPRYYKGTHMSRFVEILNEHSRRISLQNFSEILEEMKKRLDAQSAHMEITFPYFINKAAPVTGIEGLMEYRCTLQGVLEQEERSGDHDPRPHLHPLPLLQGDQRFRRPQPAGGGEAPGEVQKVRLD